MGVPQGQRPPLLHFGMPHAIPRVWHPAGNKICSWVSLFTIGPGIQHLIFTCSDHGRVKANILLPEFGVQHYMPRNNFFYSDGIVSLRSHQKKMHGLREKQNRTKQTINTIENLSLFKIHPDRASQSLQKQLLKEIIFPTMMMTVITMQLLGLSGFSGPVTEGGILHMQMI